MPNIAAFHPQIVHFVIGVLFLGVALRIVSLGRWWSFTNGAAATLLLIGTVAAAAAVHSGVEAHGPVERIPGARPLVEEHEELGETTRDIFFGVAALEILALAFMRRASLARYARVAQFASAAVGVWGGVSLYETAEHGGRLVYAYGGGPGLRTGDTADVSRVLTAALFNQAQAAPRPRPDEAAALTAQLAARLPGNRDAALIHAESQIMDSKNYAAALATLDAVTVPPDDRFGAYRMASLRADALAATGLKDSARAVLRAQLARSPNPRLQAKLDSIR